ncbi:inorganic phosphate transporter [Candidatus Gottesmanbacteria bacterium]|nr:inorganic phosphate transporter [Candidatus Gottesmanbacteria bacterium]
MEIIIIAAISLALFFDFVNGFHDSANAIATIVVTRVLSAHQAVLIAALGNFIGAFFFPVAVATTVGRGIVDPKAVSEIVIISGLIGAIVWDLITWRMGLPTSSSHALIGGLVGAALVGSGWGAVKWSGVVRTAEFIVIAPILGIVGAMVFTLVVFFLVRNKRPGNVDKYFRKLQLISSTFYAISHGTNDAQKTMGVISALLLSSGFISSFYVPVWVILSAHAAIALGTYFGGWRIVKTLGTKIKRLRPVDGFAAETSGGLVLLFTALSGIPVSTTHVISGAVIGVGSVKNISSVRWIVARRIFWAWIFTIPMSAMVAAFTFMILNNFLK